MKVYFNLNIREGGFSNNLNEIAAMWQSCVSEDGSFRLKSEDLEGFVNDYRIPIWLVYFSGFVSSNL